MTQALSDYEFGVELWIMRDGVNRNKWDYRNLDKYYLTFVGTPILCAFVGRQVGDGHNMREMTDENGETYYSFTDATSERIVGTLSENKDDFSLIERDGHTWIRATGRLFRFYAPELVDKIIRTGRMEVSAETDVREGETNGDIEIFTEWYGLGVTILGDHVSPAIPGANIQRLAAAQEQLKDIKLQAAALKNNEKKPQTENKGVRKPMKMLSKKQTAELAKKFDGYHVVAAAENESTIYLCMMDKSGITCTYTMSAGDSEVIESRIQKVAATARFAFDEAEEICVDVAVSDMCDIYASEANRLSDELEACRNEVKEAKDTIRTMQETESARRVKAAKNAAETALEAFNSVNDENIGKDAIQSVMNDIDNGVYANSMGKDNLWNGEECVRNAVLALCASAVMERKANEKKTVFAWEKFGTNSANDDSVEGLLSKWGIR